MEMRRLGRTDCEVSVLGFGAWITGADTASHSIAEDSLVRAIEVAIDAGVTWVDTAEIYAEGRSEELVGRALRGVRDEVFVATKVAPSGAGSGVRPGDIARAVKGSLTRLGMDRIDLYQLHWHDASVPLEESWGAMRELVDAGLIRFAGLSNVDLPMVKRCLSVGPVDAVQNQLSLLHRDDDNSFLRWLQERGVGYVAYGSLAFGLLTGAIDSRTRFEPQDWRSGAPARYETNYYEALFAPDRLRGHLVLVRDLAGLAETFALPLGTLALRWVLERPGVTAALMGSLKPAHIRTNALAGEVRLDSPTRDRIKEVLARHE